jgi:hypothetical protein
MACSILTTVTASFSRLSPNTTMYSISFTWISSKTANTATGSTALISAENRNMSRMGVSQPNMPLFPSSHSDTPAVRQRQSDRVRLYLHSAP